MFVRTEHDLLVIVPTNELLFIEESFTIDEWPTDLKAMNQVYTCE
jgi:hypothetical protein